MFEAGQIVRFYYLWARQADRGEEAGRKPRPVCVVVKTASAIFLLPITTREPASTAAALEIPEIECRRGGLRSPSWIIVDEYNRISLGTFYDFESPSVLGAFSPAFLVRVAKHIKRAAAEKRLKTVIRS